MIINLPAPRALDATALKLFFRAWQGIVLALRDFDEMHDGSIGDWFDSTEDLYAEERAQYIEEAQEDFHALASMSQQANELALKARIASVSPYLLLLNSDVKLKNGSEPIEFASLRTLDAVDLPKAVNTLTPTPVSESYQQRYSEMRIQRNRYSHLGDTSAVLDPITLCATLTEQYLELWPDGAWLLDRIASTYGREGFFQGKHWSPLQEILHLTDYDRALIPPATFKKLFTVKKADVRFGCFTCQDDWAVSRDGPGIVEAPTAYYDSETKAMHCLACEADFETVSRDCDECDGPFAAPDAAENGAGRCFSCGAGDE